MASPHKAPERVNTWQIMPRTHLDLSPMSLLASTEPHCRVALLAPVRKPRVSEEGDLLSKTAIVMIVARRSPAGSTPIIAIDDAPHRMIVSALAVRLGRERLRVARMGGDTPVHAHAVTKFQFVSIHLNRETRVHYGSCPWLCG